MAKAKKEEVVEDTVVEEEVIETVVVTEDTTEVQDAAEEVVAVLSAEELTEELNVAITHRDEFEKTCMSAAYLNKLSPKKRAQTLKKFGELKLAVRYIQDGLADTL